METKSKEGLKRNGLHGITQNIKAVYQRMTMKFSVEASGVAALSVTSYETSGACRSYSLEVECRRSQAFAEAHRQTLR